MWFRRSPYPSACARGVGMNISRSKSLMTLVVLAGLVLGIACPARASTAGTFQFAMTMTMYDFPCPLECPVTNLSGHVLGAMGRISPNGATACVPSCQLSQTPLGVHVTDSPCVAGVPLNGAGYGRVQVNGGISTGASVTPLVIDFSNFGYLRLGVVVIGSLAGEQVGELVGLWRPVSGIDCLRGNGPATFQIIGIGVLTDP